MTADVVYHFEDHVRRSFGFATPNYAGAVLAVAGLLLVTWPDVAGERRFGRVRLLAIAVVMGMLAFTYSRGAVAGMLLGAVWVLAVGWRTLPGGPRRRLIGRVIVMIGGLSVVGAVNGFWHRAAPGYVATDGAVTTRLAAWAGALQAVRDRPWSGWGFARSGEVYADYYQPVADTTNYTTPVNGILTVAVEWGLPVLALLGLLVFYAPVAVLGAPDGAGRRAPLAAAGLVVFGANVFSTLGLGMVLPAAYGVLAFGAVVLMVRDLRAGRWRALAVSVGLAMLLSVGLGIAGACARTEGWRVQWKGEGDVVLSRDSAAGGPPVGGAAGRMLFLQDPALVGRHNVREVRRFLQRHSAVSVCEVKWAVPEELETAALTKWPVVVAMGDWVPLVAQSRALQDAALVAVYPTVDPSACEFAGHGSRLRAVVLPAVDRAGVADKWVRYAEAAGAPLLCGDYREVGRLKI